MRRKHNSKEQQKVDWAPYLLLYRINHLAYRQVTRQYVTMTMAAIANFGTTDSHTNNLISAEAKFVGNRQMDALTKRQ